MTCVERAWKLQAFADQELTELAGKSWEKVAQLAMSVATKLGASVIVPKFELADPMMIRKEIYRHDWVKKQLEEAKSS